MTLNEVWNELIDEVVIQIKTGVTELADTTQNNSFDATTATFPTGTLSAIQFTSLQTGDFIDSFSIKVNVAAGNIRIKIYGDNNNSPNILLGESGSLSIGATVGTINFRMKKQIEIPSDGIIWCAIENDNAVLDLDISTGQSSGSLYTVAHTFGDGPDPFAGSSGTSPFWCELHTKPKVVKHYGVRGSQPEDYFAIVAAGNMETGSYTSRGSINKFEIMFYISYRGIDFRDCLTKILKVASDIYDILHRTTLNGKVRQCDVTTMNPSEIEEGKNLYLTGLRITLMCEKAVIQA